MRVEACPEPVILQSLGRNENPVTWHVKRSVSISVYFAVVHVPYVSICVNMCQKKSAAWKLDYIRPDGSYGWLMTSLTCNMKKSVELSGLN